MRWWDFVEIKRILCKLEAHLFANKKGGSFYVCSSISLPIVFYQTHDYPKVNIPTSEMILLSLRQDRMSEMDPTNLLFSSKEV